MAVRFIKLKTMNLDDDDQEESGLIEGEEGGEAEGEEVVEADGGVWDSSNDRWELDEGKVKLMTEDDDITEVKNKGRPSRWRGWWRSRGSYALIQRGKYRKCPCNSWKAVAIAVITFTTVFLISLIISIVVSEPPEPPKGAVATDVPVCSDMSAEILRRGGSGVDAAITGMLCVGVVHAESSGIGGGGFMVIRHTNSCVYTINFRETAPNASTVDMYHSNGSLSTLGGLSVGVPGEVKGMETAHKLFGKLPWKDLFQPVIKMCRDGFNMTNHTELTLAGSWEHMSSNSLFRQIYLNGDGTLKKAGDLVKRPVLADTLETIANMGSEGFYSGPIARSIVDAVSQSSTGGILTMNDLSNYEARLKAPVHVDLNGYTAYSTPAPSGGPLLLFILNVMDRYHVNASSSFNLTYHRLVEAFKYGFALRTLLADPDCDLCVDNRDDILNDQLNMTSESYAAKVQSSIEDGRTYNISHYHAHYYTVPDSGTSHLSVLSPDGQAVSVTSTINTYFGSKVITSTGIVLNNEMDDFSSPNITNSFNVKPSEANFIHPGQRPLSSTCPLIITHGQAGTSDVPVRLIIGASGGTKIPTAVAQAALRVVSWGESISDAIKAKRLHHQLFPNLVYWEDEFPNGTLEFLSQRGHKINGSPSGSVGVVQGIAVDSDGNTEAFSDSRKDGQEGHAVVVERT